jgi:menaquinol-cytochrome c reductase iron-sulfur subunit
MTERRTVLKVVASAVGAGAVGIAAVPAAGLVLAPAKATGGGAAAGEGAGRWITVARLDALELGKPTKVAVVGAETDAWTVAPDRRLGAVWLIRDGEGAVRAYSVICPHLGCGVELDRDHFACPCHDSVFDLQGHRTAGPSPRAMDPIEVRLADGAVAVNFRRFRIGVPERIPVG